MLILVLGTVISFSSCSNDDDDSDEASSLVGRWYLTPDEDDSGIEFHKDGTTYNHNWWGTGKGSYVYNKSKATLTIRSPRRTETYYNVQITAHSLTFFDDEAYTHYFSR